MHEYPEGEVDLPLPHLIELNGPPGAFEIIYGIFAVMIYILLCY